jgi:hypothetical protein
MPRTAPTVDGSGNYREVTIKTIDANNGKRSDTYRVASDATDAELEEIIVQLALASNSNVYQVKVSMVYNSVANPGDATESPILSVWDNVVTLFKDSAGNARDWFIPAPIDALLVAGTENVDSSNAILIDWRDAVDAALETAFQPVTYRFSQRSKKNPATPA